MKITRNILFLFFLIFVVKSFAQKEGNIWYFGANAGIDFNGASPLPLTNGYLNTFEGCASICDSSGALLFYTDGISVWNRNHSLMPNGKGLMGDPSSTQSAIIVKKPGSFSLYYIFTVDDIGGPNGLRYSIVDMKLENGLGNIDSSKNILILTPTCEKITAVTHQNGFDFWIITHHFGSNKYYSYLLSSKGLDITNPVISTVGSTISISQVNNALGCIKASQSGNRIAAANYGLGTLEVFDFNKSTGKLTNPMVFSDFYHNRPYGVEFSPNNNVLYLSNYSSGYIYQFNLAAGSYSLINSSRQTIYAGANIVGSLQLAPDNRIYVSHYDRSYLGVIMNPNKLGLACNHKLDGIYLAGRNSKLGLPAFFNSIFNPISFSFNNICYGDSTCFFISSLSFDSLFWDFGDSGNAANNTSTIANPKHVFSTPDNYTVTIIAYINGIAHALSENIHIVLPLPSLNLGNDTTICDDELFSIQLDKVYDNCIWNDFSSSSTFKINRTGRYWVEVSNQCGKVYDTINVIVKDCHSFISLPNAFSPNADGINDYFKPINANEINTKLIQIFNRWGNIVFESKNFSKPWNGNYKDNACSEGVYFWVVSYSDYQGDTRIKRGIVTLLR